MSSPVQEFADNLKLIRKGRKLTQTQLAEKVGLTKQSIINYEKGITFPTGKRLRNLLDALDVTTEQLLGRELSQSTNEKILLERCREKAKFFEEYNVSGFFDQNTDDECVQFLLHHLSQFDHEELLDAVLSIYDNRILSAQADLSHEMARAHIPNDAALNIDVVIKQNEDDE